MGLLLLQVSPTQSVASGITVVQSKSGTTANGSAGLTVNFDTPVKAGNSVIALISYDAAAGVDSDPALVGGGAEPMSAVVAVGAGSLVSRIDAAMNVAGGETGAHYGVDTPVRANLTILEVSRLADAPAEATNTNSGNNATASFTAVTPASARNLVIGIAAYSNATQAYSSGPTSPFNRVGTGTGGASTWQEVVYAIQSAATTQSSNMNIVLTGAKDFATANAVFGGS
jgi:hypothetical protein